MTDYLDQLFADSDLIHRVQNKMPSLFQLAELESSRAGKLGMEIGSARERIIIALLMYKFGEENVNTLSPITESEIDVTLFNNPISIKTVTGNLTGIKLIWTVDAQKAIEFSQNYKPSVDILLAQIRWGETGYFYYIPVESQVNIFEELGREKYIKLPKQGTNPRGVEITKEALMLLVEKKEVMKIEIKWNRTEVNSGIYDRWVKLWGD
jgi:hypothetical protein